MEKKEKSLWVIGFDDWEYNTSSGEKIPTWKYCWIFLKATHYHKSGV